MAEHDRKQSRAVRGCSIVHVLYCKFLHTSTRWQLLYCYSPATQRRCRTQIDARQVGWRSISLRNAGPQNSRNPAAPGFGSRSFIPDAIRHRAPARRRAPSRAYLHSCAPQQKAHQHRPKHQDPLFCPPVCGACPCRARA